MDASANPREVGVSFGSLEAARAAALRLEQHGVDGAFVELRPLQGRMQPTGVDAPGEGRTGEADLRAAQRFHQRALRGGAVAAASLATVVVVAVVVTSPERASWWLAVGLVAAVFVGFTIGGFLALESRLPTSTDTLDSIGSEDLGPTTVVVRAPDPAMRRKAEKILLDARSG
jgi:hypothetical protein